MSDRSQAPTRHSRPQAELQRLIARDRAGRPRRTRAEAEHHNAAKTRCRRGHPFDAANTYYDAAGERRCRVCLRAAWRRWKAERRPPTHRAPGGVVWMPEPSVVPPGTAVAEPMRPHIRRRSRQQGRAQRWDAHPVLTARDAAALRFVGEHYAVRDDVLAVLLGRLSPAKPKARGMLGPRTLRQRLARWQQAGWQGIDQAWELVEVELTQKTRPLVAALKSRPPHTAAITYYVPAALHAALSAQLASVVRELGGRPQRHRPAAP